MLELIGLIIANQFSSKGKSPYRRQRHTES